MSEGLARPILTVHAHLRSTTLVEAMCHQAQPTCDDGLKWGSLSGRFRKHAPHQLYHSPIKAVDSPLPKIRTIISTSWLHHIKVVDSSHLLDPPTTKLGPISIQIMQITSTLLMHPTCLVLPSKIKDHYQYKLVMGIWYSSSLQAVHVQVHQIKDWRAQNHERGRTNHKYR